MSNFILHLNDGSQKEVTADTLSEAAAAAEIYSYGLSTIIAFSKDGERTEICGRMSCGCVHHAEDGLSCRHDLELVGLSIEEAA